MGGNIAAGASSGVITSTGGFYFPVNVIMPVRRKVAFDVDDTLCPYTRSIANSLSIPYETWIDFHHLNPFYSEEQKQAITQAYSNPIYYEKMRFYPGFSEILDLEAFGADIQFNSTSFAQVLLDAKRRCMLEAVPNLRDEQFQFRLTRPGEGEKKDYDDDTYIAIDDSPYAIARSKAEYAIMPRTPWNQTTKAFKMVAHKKYVFYTPEGDLYAIYNIVKELLLAPAV